MADHACPACEGTEKILFDEDLEDQLTMMIEKVAQTMVNEAWSLRFPRHAERWRAKVPGCRTPPWVSPEQQAEVLAEFRKLPIDVLKALLKVAQ